MRTKIEKFKEVLVISVGLTLVVLGVNFLTFQYEVVYFLGWSIVIFAIILLGIYITFSDFNIESVFWRNFLPILGGFVFSMTVGLLIGYYFYYYPFEREGSTLVEFDTVRRATNIASRKFILIIFTGIMILRFFLKKAERLIPSA